MSEASESQDLSRLLRNWPYTPGEINVRVITGDDGEPKIQMRLDLGVLQMEASGRPDGERPNGYESWLDCFESALDEHEPEDAEEPFILSPEDCRLLRDETVQVYHRYVSLLILGDYLGVVRDTTRNLRALDLCRDHAESEEDQTILEQFRPYLVMMKTRALASQAVSDDEPKLALVHLEQGLDEIRALFEGAGQAEAFDEANEVQLLRGMRSELLKKLPAGQRAELKQRLQEAIERENYELAAILRDELKNLPDAQA